MKIAIQNPEFGQRGGVNTYSLRLNRYLNELDDVESIMFIEKCKDKDVDVISIQYEPGCYPPQRLQHAINEFEQPIVVTAHHTLGLEQFYPMLDGVVIHSDNQIQSKPWSYSVVAHPALVFPKKDKKKLRKKYKLPKDKKIVGTMGFICGTGKNLPGTVKEILKRLNDDEFLYLITPFWKGGDMGRLESITKVVKELGKEDNFRIDTDFTVNEEELNEKMQCCDLMYCWNNMTNFNPGSQSGSAADIYGARVKMIVKNNPHFEFIAQQDKVLTGRDEPQEFAEDVVNALRNEDLNDVQDPEWLSWEKQVEEYANFFKEVCDL